MVPSGASCRRRAENVEDPQGQCCFDHARRADIGLPVLAGATSRWILQTAVGQSAVSIGTGVPGAGTGIFPFAVRFTKVGHSVGVGVEDPVPPQNPSLHPFDFGTEQSDPVEPGLKFFPCPTNCL